jgi:4a-hydroxytetrahydrobiopterin dehydratase
MTGKECIPCSQLDPSSLLSIEEVTHELENMPLWKWQHSPDGKDCISRRYTAISFQAALDSMNAMGAIAEQEGHHPDFHLTNYREVEVVLYTHKVGGLTKKDIDLAKQFDSNVHVKYSPKWEKEHLPPDLQSL